MTFTLNKFMFFIGNRKPGYVMLTLMVSDGRYNMITPLLFKWMQTGHTTHSI
tara:strand:+ start:362 stop:517 length:156 start_codon:yes stop_codon:yes gene_type:complete